MAGSLNRLTARQVTTAKGPTRLADGGGLYLRITPSGSRLWVFLAKSGDARPEVSLDNANGLPLADARILAGQMREAVAKGQHPRTVLAKVEPVAPTSATPSFAKQAST